jgi:hypothetical protein
VALRSWPGRAAATCCCRCRRSRSSGAATLLAGRYLRDLGNTPGHLNHWTRRGFTRLVAGVAEVREVTSPFPWTTIWASLPD